jgi:hypothetical protein
VAFVARRKDTPDDLLIQLKINNIIATSWQEKPRTVAINSVELQTGIRMMQHDSF